MHPNGKQTNMFLILTFSLQQQLQMPHILAWNFPDTLIFSVPPLLFLFDKASSLFVALITYFSSCAPCDYSNSLFEINEKLPSPQFHPKHPPTIFRFSEKTTSDVCIQCEIGKNQLKGLLPSVCNNLSRHTVVFLFRKKKKKTISE